MFKNWSSLILIFYFFSLLPSISLAETQTETETQTKKEINTQAPSSTIEQDLTEPLLPQPSPESIPFPIVFRENTVFTLYQYAHKEGEATAKALEASRLLDSALRANQPLNPNAELVEISPVSRQKLEVRVRGYKIIELDQSEVRAAGFQSQQDYADFLQGTLQAFVSNEVEKLRVQRLALRFFLSIFFALLGFILFRQIHNLFNRAENAIDERRDSFRPISFLSETLISGQTVGGILAFSLVIGRILAYLFVVITTIIAILGQFRLTRELMTQFFSDLVSQIFTGLQSLIESIPGILLGIFLITVLYVSIRLLDLFLRGLSSGKVSWGILSRNRLPVVKFWGFLGLFIALAPLIVAAFFGRFHTPWEQIFLFAAATLLLASIPLLASIVVGSYVLWQSKINLGQWIEVGSTRGEVAAISLFEITLIPEEGGRLHIPMLSLLFKPCFERKDSPHLELKVSIKRRDSLAATLELLRQKLPTDLKVDVSCVAINHSSLILALRSDKFQSGLREKLLIALADAQDSGDILLTESLTEELTH